MGTRGLTKVIKNGKTVVAQYGQFDHYPSGQGLTALKFLRDENNVAKLDINLSYVYEIDSAEIDELWKRLGENMNTAYPSLIRDTAAEILELIANTKDPVPVFLDTDFENDELFCEGVYTVNLDDKTFTTKYDGNEITLPLDSLRAVSDDMYLEQTKCHAYAFQKATA
jgi:hypothetical protein